MRYIIFLFTVALFATAAKAQPDSLWSRTYGGEDEDWCYSVIQTSDDGFALGGFTRSFGSGDWDMWFVKTDVNGDSLWSKTFGGESWEGCYSIIQTEDGGFAVAGYTWTFGSGGDDMWLVKTNANGDSLWSRTYGGENHDRCMSIIQTEDGGYGLAGYTESFGSGLRDMWLVKINENGDSLWSHTFGGDSLDYCYTMIQTEDGGFVLAGHTKSFGAGEEDMLIVKTNEDGDSLWSRTFGGASTDNCFSVIHTEDGGFLLVGYTESFGAGGEDMWIVKVSEDGDSLWSQTFGGENNDRCWSVIKLFNYGYALAGHTESFGAGEQDVWFVGIDVNGDSLWSRTFGVEEMEACYSMIQTSDGGFALAGRRITQEIAGDMLLIKIAIDSVNALDFQKKVIVDDFFIYPAFPNPFNSTTNIRFDLPHSSDVSISICDLSGRSIATLFDNRLNAGRHNMTWDAGQYPAGMYLCTMQAGEFAMTEKLLLVK